MPSHTLREPSSDCNRRVAHSVLGSGGYRLSAAKGRLICIIIFAFSRRDISLASPHCYHCVRRGTRHGQYHPSSRWPSEERRGPPPRKTTTMTSRAGKRRNAIDARRTYKNLGELCAGGRLSTDVGELGLGEANKRDVRIVLHTMRDLRYHSLLSKVEYVSTVLKAGGGIEWRNARPSTSGLRFRFSFPQSCSNRRRFKD